MDFESILNTIQPFLVLFVALFAAFLTAMWISCIIWAFRDIRSRSRDIFAQILATLLVLIFFPLFPVPGLILYFILRPRETLAQVYERSLEEEALLQGIEERLACPGCNRRIEEDYMVCPSCHTRLKKGCLSCGRMLHLRWSICPYCGAAQTSGLPSGTLPAEPVTVSIEPAPEAAKLGAGSPLGVPEPAWDVEDDVELEPEGAPFAVQHGRSSPVPEPEADEADQDVELEADAKPDPDLEEEPDTITLEPD